MPYQHDRRMADDDEAHSEPDSRANPDPKPQHGKQEEADPAPPPHRLLAIIRFLAAHTDRVIFTDHAQERMEERDITPEHVFRGLRVGELSGRVTRGRDPKEWKCKIVSMPRGSRKMGIVSIVVMNECIIVKTVEWEDR